MSDAPVMDAARTLGPEDSEAVVGIVRAMAREMGDKLGDILKLLEPLPRIEAALADVMRRMQTVELAGYRRDDKVDALRSDVDDHETRLAALEAAQRKVETP